MSDIRKAIERFRKLEKVRSFPGKCERCSIPFDARDRVSVVETSRGPMVTHERCRRMAQIEGEALV